MGPPVELLEGRSTQIAFFVRLDSVAGTAVRLALALALFEWLPTLTRTTMT